MPGNSDHDKRQSLPHASSNLAGIRVATAVQTISKHLARTLRANQNPEQTNRFDTVAETAVAVTFLPSTTVEIASLIRALDDGKDM